MSNYIETIDHEGNKVICTSEQWYSHITNHEIMKHNRDAVIDTVSNPDEVYKAINYENRKLFFKNTSKATYSSALFTKVVVSYKNNTGEIVTAFPAKKKGSVGDALYPKQN